MYLLAVNDLVIGYLQLIFEDCRRAVDVVRLQGNMTSALHKQLLTAQVFDQLPVADN